MGYSLEWRGSPNFTPNHLVQAYYGRRRTIEIGAGHWWGDPNAGYGHDGVVASLSNPARQVSAHVVISSGRATELVDPNNVAWATGNANPYTFSIEVDPRIYNGDQGVRNTLVEYIADRVIPRFGNLEWRAHKYWMQTACNPIDWVAIRNDAYNLWVSRQTPEWKKNRHEIATTKLRVKVENAPLLKLDDVNTVIKWLPKGTEIDIKGKTSIGGHSYLISVYAFNNDQPNGLREWELEPIPAPEPEKPEWIRNLADIAPVKLMVMPAQTAIVNLNDLSTIKQLGQGTWVDFAKKTTVQGKEYLISSYSATNSLPNGILRADVGVPETPSNSEKPEWLQKWEDIADVTMYTRVDAALVNLQDGSTIKTIPRKTKIDVASTTEWHGKKYAITKYSTDKKLAQGIPIDDLDMKEPSDGPVTPAPEQPKIEDRVTALEKLVKYITDFFGDIYDNFKPNK